MSWAPSWIRSQLDQSQSWWGPRLWVSKGLNVPAHVLRILSRWNRRVRKNIVHSSSLTLPLIFTKRVEFHFIKCWSNLREVMWCERQWILWLESDLCSQTDEVCLILPLGYCQPEHCANQWLPDTATYGHRFILQPLISPITISHNHIWSK